MSYGVDKRRRVNFLAKTADIGFDQFQAVLMFPFPDTLAQFGAALLILVSTIGVTFSLQALFSERVVVDRAIRFVLAAFALVVLLCPDERIGTAACVPVLLIIGYWLAWRRTAADPSEVVAAPVLVPAVPVVDTERGRMS